MRQFETPAKWVHSLRFSPDGESIYLLAAEPYVTPDRFGAELLPQHAYRIDIGSGAVTGFWTFKQSVFASFTPDFRLLYYWPVLVPYSWDRDYRHLYRLDLDSGERRYIYSSDVDTHPPSCAALSPDGRVLALVESEGRNSGTIRQLDLQTRDEIGDPIPTEATCLAYSPTGEWLATSNPTTGVGMWRGMALVGHWPEPATALAWSGNNRLAWSTDGQFHVARTRRIARVRTRDPRRTWPGTHDPTSALAFAPDGRRLLAGAQSGVCAVHDTDAGAQLWAFDWAIGPIYSVAFSPDGLTCAAGGENGQVVVWDVDN
jgi:WD40 repeat protein